MRLITQAALLGCYLALVACSGSSGGPPPVPELSGVFLDSPVSGISYSNNAYTSTTDADGTFKYSEGTEVTFYLGDIVLGSSSGKALITPLDLGGALNDTDQSYIPTDYSTNLLRFLQTVGSNMSTLDNPEATVLEFSPEKNAAALGMQINFNQPSTDFATDPMVLTAVEVLSAINTFNNNSRELIPALEAQTHFSKNLVNTFGQPVDWQRYLGMEHGKQLTYYRAIENNGGMSTDSVSTFFKSTQDFTLSTNPTPFWVQGWSNNWKPNQFHYIRQDLTEGVKFFGYQTSNQVESFLNVSRTPIFFTHAIAGKAVMMPFIEDGVEAPSRLKIDYEINVTVSTITYPDTLKITRLVPQTNTTTESWFAADIGLIKKITHSSNGTETLELTQTEILDILPYDPATNRAEYVQLISQYSELESAKALKSIDTIIGTLYTIMLFKDDINAEELRNTLKVAYTLYITEYVYNLTNFIKDTSVNHPLDPIGINYLLKNEYFDTVISVGLYPLIFGFSNSEFLSNMNTDIYNMFHAAGNELVSSGVIPEFYLKRI